MGDIVCQVLVETPVKLSDAQKEHLRTFKTMLEEDDKNHSPHAKTWFDSVKEFFKPHS